MKYSKFEILKVKTKNTELLWKDVYGIASNGTARKLDVAMLDWQSELTNTLDIWIEKGLSMTTGELILARANIGAVVESWLKFFYCVYYDDYCREPLTNKKGKMIEPEKIKFEDLKKFSIGKLWESEQSEEYIWVDTIQDKRNAIHSFRYRDIGTPWDFLLDINLLYDFVDDILSHLPPIEDYIETFPTGYVRIPDMFC